MKVTAIVAALFAVLALLIVTFTDNNEEAAIVDAIVALTFAVLSLHERG